MSTKEIVASGNEQPGAPNWLVTTSSWAWRLTAIAAFVALLAVIFYQLRVVTVPVFIALLLSTLLLPPVRFLESKGFKPGAATGTVFLGITVLLAGLVYSLAGPIGDEFQDLGPQVQEAVHDVNDWLITGPLSLEQAQLDQYVETLRNQLKENSGAVGTGLVHSATLAAEMFAGLILTIILTFFFVKDGHAIVHAIARKLPEARRPLVLAAGNRAFQTLGGYLRGVALTGIVDATLIGIALYVVGVPLLLPLVILTFLGAFFPVVGATVAGALAAAIALVNGGPGDMFIVIGAVLVVQQLEGHLLQPLLVGRAVALHPIVILMALGSGAIIAGLLGAFLAVPVVATVSAIAREMESHSRAAKAIKAQLAEASSGVTVSGESTSNDAV